MGTRALPDIYALSPRACGPRASGIHIRQSTCAHVITYTYLLSSEAIHQRVLYCDISDITREKNQRNILLVPKEALIGEHNLKPLITVHKESID